jgi:tetratricopeptide (TPR) repeat protein
LKSPLFKLQLTQKPSQTLLPPSLKLKALRSLGLALQVVGSKERSQQILEQSLTISRQIGSVADTSEILGSLGNTKRSLQQHDEALKYYQQAAATATTSRVKIEALLNQLSLYVDLQIEPPNSLIPQIKTQLENLPASRISIYAAVNFAQSLYNLTKSHKNASNVKTQDAAQILARAISAAESINDLRGLTYSLNELGKLYENSQQLDEALSLSAKALKISQAINANDKNAAIIYPIILSDRIEVILSLPKQPLSSYRTSQSQSETEQTIKLMRQSLNPAFSNQERLQVSQKLYDWLIRPTQSQLSQHNINFINNLVNQAFPKPKLYAIPNLNF